MIICVVWDTKEYKANALHSKNNLNEKIQNIKKKLNTLSESQLNCRVGPSDHSLHLVMRNSPISEKLQLHLDKIDQCLWLYFWDSLYILPGS